MAKSAIQKQRENTWDGVLPNQSAPGIKVSPVDQLGPNARKAAKARGVQNYTDYTNANYPADGKITPPPGNQSSLDNGD